MDEKFWQWQYATSVTNPGGWLSNAVTLKKSADLIFAQCVLDRENSVFPETYRVYFMLAGLAMENLIKGIFVSKIGGLESDGMKPVMRIFRHNDLKIFLDECGIRLSKAEYEMLTKLEYNVTSWGRYHIAKSFEKQYPSLKKEDTRLPISGIPKPNYEQIMKRNDAGDYSELPTIDNDFHGEADQTVIDRIYTRLEVILEPYAANFRPDFNKLAP
jgi:hypothetical protein